MPEGLDLAKALEQATVAAIEHMCFTAVMGPAPTAVFEGSLSAEVAFKGDAEGIVRIQLTPEAAVTVTSGFVGSDVSGPEDPSIATVLLEVANMICGRMLSLHAPSGWFTLEPPRAAGSQDTDPAAACAFELESGMIRVAATIAHAGDPR